ncbi:hypothetical protein ACTVZO_12830 [Streptomyces sp. IBSNAI002]|uniref:hypothetical protein n=1 Tax=Streptomyces sp. IBSNAI002 TaxID=3457500 RepID=UPI003FD16231
MTTYRMSIAELPTMALDAHDPPDSPWPSPHVSSGLSQELLDRALVGWERFLSSVEEDSDD